MNISILNLHRNMDKDQLEKLFASYGKVESCEIILDKNTGKSKGFGFVTMTDEAEANKAVSELHGKTISNQKIRVKISG
ncbi:MAG: RNA-binding protein [Alphaproteobacteria bacterium]|nr:RNA-binding protein [Alphaproteobacteria bacterium]